MSNPAIDLIVPPRLRARPAKFNIHRALFIIPYSNATGIYCAGFICRFSE
jgi:hypothetical protein